MNEYLDRFHKKYEKGIPHRCPNCGRIELPEPEDAEGLIGSALRGGRYVYYSAYNWYGAAFTCFCCWKTFYLFDNPDQDSLIWVNTENVNARDIFYEQPNGTFLRADIVHYDLEKQILRLLGKE